MTGDRIKQIHPRLHDAIIRAERNAELKAALLKPLEVD